jgi:Tfp pilus assembly protein PilV
MKKTSHAFSLIEVVISLGIFAFCIVGIVGLLPIAANSVKSVSLESTANNIAESIAGFWEVAPLLTSSGPNFTMGNFTIGNGTQTVNYTISGTESSSASDAALRLNYEANSLGAANPNTFTVNLTFTWPPNASSNSTTATTRTFNYIFTK